MINDFINKNEEKGFLINENNNAYTKLFEFLKANQLELETSDKPEKFISEMEGTFNKFYLSKDNMNIDKKILQNNFTKSKYLYIKYKNDEKLMDFDRNHPLLVYYFNNHKDINEKFQTNGIMTNYKQEPNCIPLWLICLRSLANSNNINVCFKNITEDFKIEFNSKIINTIKNK
jgi:hypothetical protein